eukprot:CAMPEP_0173229450 /NCGR_PEP_ID=MMETSP1142-20121109/7142_1 /TAXON_ID=483371 /ORGANISM="non described non described, Strain CCMP2298" /LENGTH=95 /DNA_ID=CAMNT_0014158311 /DNA_START=283 /DNA_END=571 /DNA_ORIENTATION=-
MAPESSLLDAVLQAGGATPTLEKSDMGTEGPTRLYGQGKPRMLRPAASCADEVQLKSLSSKICQGDLDRQLSHRLLHAAAPALLPAVPRRTVNER